MLSCSISHIPHLENEILRAGAALLRRTPGPLPRSREVYALDGRVSRAAKRRVRVYLAVGPVVGYWPLRRARRAVAVGLANWLDHEDGDIVLAAGVRPQHIRWRGAEPLLVAGRRMAAAGIAAALRAEQPTHVRWWRTRTWSRPS